MKPRVCAECGTEFVPGKRHGEFCKEECRIRFRNRRNTRGAALYDMMMAHRFERGRVDADEIRSAMYTFVSLWREEDKAEREGRQSWNDPRAHGAIMERDLSWKAQILTKRSK